MDFCFSVLNVFSCNLNSSESKNVCGLIFTVAQLLSLELKFVPDSPLLPNLTPTLTRPQTSPQFMSTLKWTHVSS
jgi:hypothetical protein